MSQPTYQTVKLARGRRRELHLAVQAMVRELIDMGSGSAGEARWSPGETVGGQRGPQTA
jgi:hypothetical protein